MLRKGFTLIELLIVITIIAILAGAAIPYVQDYVEDARLSKARADLAELRNAIVRYETERGVTFPGASDDTFQEELIGPYLQSAITDPWGSPYYFSNEASIVYSAAADRDRATNIISQVVRPALSPTRAYWVDVDNNGRINAGDFIDIRFTRDINVVGTAADLTLSGGANIGDGTVVPVPDPDGKGLNWLRYTLAGVPDMTAGITITVGVTVTDNTGGDAALGAVFIDQTCNPIPVVLKPAQ